MLLSIIQRLGTALTLYLRPSEQDIVLIVGHPDKDEYGHILSDGFDPIAQALDDGGRGGKRKRTQRNGEVYAVGKTMAKAKQKRWE